MSFSLSDTLEEKKNLLHSVEGWLILFEAVKDASTSYRFVSDSSNFTWNSETYYAMSMALSDLRITNDGSLNSVNVFVSNVTKELVADIESDVLIDQPCWVRIVHSSSSAAADVLERPFTCTNISMDRRNVVFSLGHVNLFAKPFPLNRISRSRCRWVFKDVNCGYAGAISTCDLTLDGTDGCKTHGTTGGGDSADHPRRFGGFPGIPRSR